jgi:MFS family permease
VSCAWRVFVVFAAAHFLSYFFRSANAVIATDLTIELGLTPAQLGLMSSLFFGAFALAQLPFGVLLDRFGPRLTTAGLMLAGVAGAVVFAFAPNVAVLGIGRALLGLGTAGILMGGLKALSMVLPPGRFAAVSGMLVAVGSSGALVATAPLALLVRAWGWRPAFVLGAAVLLVSAVAVALGARTPAAAPAHEDDVRAGFRGIFGNLTFWRLALMGFALMGTTFAYQSLWAGPYLTDAAGVPTGRAGSLLLWLGIGLILGFFVSGWLAERFGLARVLALATVVAIAAQVVLAVAATGAPDWLLATLLFTLASSGSFALLLYAQANVLYPPRSTGRVVTAINLFMFLGGFVLQWGIGVVVGSFPPVAGHAPTAAYGGALLATAALCTVALAVYLPTLRRTRA